MDWRVQEYTKKKKEKENKERKSGQVMINGKTKHRHTPVYYYRTPFSLDLLPNCLSPLLLLSSRQPMGPNQKPTFDILEQKNN